MSSEEEGYIRQKEIDKLHAERRKRQLDALRQEEAKGIAIALNTSEEVADEALELGFDKKTASVLPMIPLIEVAWADDKITDAESEKVLELANATGVVEPEAVQFLELLLANKPSKAFFERTNRVLAHMIQANPENLKGKSVLEQARMVAEASGGFFGLGNKVSAEEEEMLAELAALLSVD